EWRWRGATLMIVSGLLVHVGSSPVWETTFVAGAPIVNSSSLACHGHLADQDRPGPQVRARIDVASDRLDRSEHVLQVAGDGEPVHRVADPAILDPEAGRTARIVAGDGVHALPHQFVHQHPAFDARD